LELFLVIFGGSVEDYYDTCVEVHIDLPGEKSVFKDIDLFSLEFCSNDAVDSFTGL
jgi:hypothetical protein